MKKYNVDIDIDFCNMLIKQRALRMDYESARVSILNVVCQYNFISSDIINNFGNKFSGSIVYNSSKLFATRYNHIWCTSTKLSQEMGSRRII